MEINIADDYFKARNKVELLEQDLKAKENELYDLKHELIATQIKLENTSKSLKEAQDEIKKILWNERMKAETKKDAERMSH